VRRSVRHGRDVWLCEQVAAAIPVWMTDCVACAALSIGPVLVSVDALAELASLVNASRSAHDRVVDLPEEGHDATSTAETTAHAIRPRAAGRRAADADRAGLVKALADLLLASAVAADDDEERDHAREDHR
jgi:hypothetical protein